MDENSDIFFHGGAYGIVYYLGVLSKLKKPSKTAKIYGVSAGSLVAMMYLLGFSRKRQYKLMDYIMDNSIDRIITDPFNIDSYVITHCHYYVLKKLIDKYPDAYKTLTGRLYIGISTIDYKTRKLGFEWKSDFKDNTELCHYLMCGFHIPYICSYSSKLSNNCYAMDGVLMLDENKDLPRHVIKIGLYDKYTLYRTKYYHVHNTIPIHHCLMPITRYYREKYFDMGKNDMETFIKENKGKNGIPKSPKNMNIDKLSFVYKAELSAILRLIQKTSDAYTIDTLREYLEC